MAMRPFRALYDWSLQLAQHRLAPAFLCLNSFIESIFWPIPGELMLVPMSLSAPQLALHYASLTVISSVLGAVCGYYLGYFIYDPYVAAFIAYFDYTQAMMTVRQWLTAEYGLLMVFIGAFTPVPYKVIALTTGVVAAEAVASTGSSGMINVVSFVLVSLVGRGLRFYLIALAIRWGGERMAAALRRNIELIGWACIAAIAVWAAWKLLA